MLPLVYEELRKLAACKMANESPDQTLQPTALVHEAWLRLTGRENMQWNGRAHFFAAAAEAMRRILIDNARRKRAVRHGGEHQRVDILEQDLAASAGDDQLLAINDALDKLALHDEPKAELVKLPFFRRPHHRGSRRYPRHLRGHGQTPLDLRSRLAQHAEINAVKKVGKGLTIRAHRNAKGSIPVFDTCSGFSLPALGRRSESNPGPVPSRRTTPAAWLI